MADSQNGWPVATKAQCDQGPFQGEEFPNGILKGDVATIARWHLARYEALVEPLMIGACWGWFVKKILGSSTYSNHASGTAWDVNAPKYPLGALPADVMTAKKITACRQIVKEFGGVLRWGGDYSGRKDVMHWEINKGETAVAALAEKIKSGLMPGQEDLVTPADLAKIQTMINTAVSGAVSALRAEIAKIPAADLATPIGDKAVSTRDRGDNERDFAKLRGTLVLAPGKEPVNKVMEPGSPLDRIVRAADKILEE